MSKMIAVRLDDRLLRDVDRERRKKQLTRAVAIREALVAWVEQRRLEEAMRRDAQGYAEHPVTDTEFGPILSAQRWPK